jgi:MoxR-like ATPase
VPNALLDALGHGRFSAPGREVCRQGPPPLVIFTTNEERSLPEAFLRRCLSLELALPEDKAALRDWLWARGRRHFPQISEAVQGEVAGLLHEDRQRCQELGLGEPGLAEHLDLLRALQALAPGKEEQQRRMIGVLRRFHFQKHPRSGP